MAYIHLNSVSVDFPIYNVNARSLKKSLLRLTTGGSFGVNEKQCVVIKALDDITFSLNDGDRLGLIGHNGAGKSTLLRVLATIYEPSRGSFGYKGRISPLLDVMLGINQELTGYENISLRGSLLGLKRKELKLKMKDIADFTELGDFLHMPTRTYSSGMLMRLAFAVATSIQPDILLMDEAIGVGDKNFIDKANERLTSMINKSNILVIASHSDTIIQKFCNKVLVLDTGRFVKMGSVSDILT